MNLHRPVRSRTAWYSQGNSSSCALCVQSNRQQAWENPKKSRAGVKARVVDGWPKFKGGKNLIHSQPVLLPHPIASTHFLGAVSLVSSFFFSYTGSGHGDQWCESPLQRVVILIRIKVWIETNEGQKTEPQRLAFTLSGWKVRCVPGNHLGDERINKTPWYSFIEMKSVFCGDDLRMRYLPSQSMYYTDLSPVRVTCSLGSGKAKSKCAACSWLCISRGHGSMRLANLIEEENHKFYGTIEEVFKLILIFLWSWLKKPKFRTEKHLRCFSRQLICLRDFSESLKQISDSLHHTLKTGKELQARPSRARPLKMMWFKPSDIKNDSQAGFICQIFQHGHT